MSHFLLKSKKENKLKNKIRENKNENEMKKKINSIICISSV